MDELIDIVDTSGKPTGKTALKSEIHKNGWYHNTVHLWLYNSKAEVLLQQRSHKKKIHPLLWDVSVAGHVDAGETFIEAAIRETEEEIGLKLKASQLVKIGTHLYKSEYNEGAIKDYEFHQVYISKIETKVEALSPQEDEVEALKFVSFAQFEKLLQHSEKNLHFISTNKPYYITILNHIKNQFK